MRCTGRLFKGLCAGLLGAAFAAPLTLAEPISLEELSAYLRGLDTVRAPFLQQNSDQSTSSGTLYIHHPGRLRLEYAPPNAGLVLIGSGQIAIFDAKSNEPPEQYPLRRTPMSLFLRRNVDLASSPFLAGHEQVGETTQLISQDPKRPENGAIELVFTDAPIALRQWIFIAPGGERTRITLGDLEQGVDIPARVFDIEAEIAARAQN